MLKCTINGKSIEVPEGTNVIDAFKIAGEDIAHYCYHPGLSVAGVCRMCMVAVEGQPRLGIACNMQVTDNMVVSNQDDKVKEAVKWTLDFHLINHPLDCPICDQAGECGLQNQYMEFGKYTPEMSLPKVKKHKVVDLGPKVVLDSERCILCSRCVRFTDEVTKTGELGIFNRGDRSEIGTFENKPLNNNYSLNTVDICPVGALTSKDFRFQQRVWFLKEAESVCPGCSTGCNVKVYYNEKGVFRVTPVYNEKVNGYWMCDEGRDVYKYVNKQTRLLKAVKNSGSTQNEMLAGEAAKNLAATLSKEDPASVALVLTGQYTSEELDQSIAKFKTKFGIQHIYHWINNAEGFEQFDGLLLRGDRNPNTKGLLQMMNKHGVTAVWSHLESELASGKIKTVIVAGPENQSLFADVAEKVSLFAKAQRIIWLTACPVEALSGISAEVWQIPLKTFIEKSGTFVNHSGLEQKIKQGFIVVSEALTLNEVSELLTEGELTWVAPPTDVNDGLVSNHYLHKAMLREV